MASDIYYSTNPADWTQLEGVYISEIPVASQVEGANMQTVSFAGKCVRGPVDVCLQVNTPERFQAVYGGRSVTPAGPLVGEVWKGIIGKPFAPIVVRRVASSAAVAATFTPGGGAGAVCMVAASSVGAWGNTLVLEIKDASDGDVNHWNLSVTSDGKTLLWENLDITVGNNNLNQVIGDDYATPIRVTKTADGRPTNTTTPKALTGGDDGTIADTDYITGITDLAYVDGVTVCLIPEAAPTQATVNQAIVQLAAQANDRCFFLWSGVHTNTPDQEITAKKAQVLTPGQRVYWFFNSAKVIDPVTGAKVDVAPHTFAASIISQNFVDVHIGAYETLKQTAGVVGLRNESLRRADLIQLRSNGIMAFEKQKRGFRFRSGIATDAKTRLVDRRERDYLQMSAGEFLAPFVDETNIVERRAQMTGGIAAFSDDLMTSQRIIEDYRVKLVTTEAQRAQNMEFILWEVRLIGHLEFIILMTNIGTGVTIDTGQVAA